MTLDEIRASDKAMLTPAEVADVLGCNAHSIRVQAQNNPNKLGFNVAVIGSRTLIPRIPFIQFLTHWKGATK